MDAMPKEADKSLSAVKSASRTLDLLEFLAQNSAGASFNDVKAALDIPDSSLSQLLGTLAARDYVAHLGPRGGYALGPALGRLARQFMSSQSLADQLGPICRDLCMSTGETVILHELTGHLVRIVAVHVPDDPALIYAPKVGATAPLHVAAAGKAFLAAMSQDRVEDYLTAAAADPALTRGPFNADAVRSEIAAIRSEGIARNNQDSTPGIVALSAAVRRQGEPVASLTVGLPAARYDDKVDTAIGAVLREAAAGAVRVLAN